MAQQVGGETVVYDLSRHRAHSLNVTASAVWRLCDGSRSVREIADQVKQDQGAAVDEEVVWLALKGLDRAHLLRNPLPSHPSWITRRELMRRLKLTGSLAVLLPVVTSIAAPTPAEAATCLGNGATCTSNGQCCSGVCGASGTGTCIGG